jgi:hypothetical protein
MDPHLLWGIESSWQEYATHLTKLARLEHNEAHVAHVKIQNPTLMNNELQRHKLLPKTRQPITEYLEQKPTATNQLNLSISDVALSAGVSTCQSPSVGVSTDQSAALIYPSHAKVSLLVILL